ncbi:MAG: ABC transporter substrate-binding protein [Pseudonocardia sp.]
MGVRSWRSAAVACAAVLAAAVLAGCGGGSAGGGTAPSAPAPAEDGYPVTVQNCGRTLTFDRAPSRMLLGYHPVAEIAVGLGLADRAVGRTGYAGGLSKAPVLPEQQADFDRIPVVSDNNYPPPKEQLLTLRPDFILGYGIFDVGGDAAGAPGLATMDELTAAGIPIYMATCPDGIDDPGGGYGQDTLAATYQTILDVGRIFGVSERAEQRVAEMKAQIEAVRARTGTEGSPKVLLYSRGTGPIEVVGGRSLITEIVEAAGGTNVFADGKIFFEASKEAVAARPADVFLIFSEYGSAAEAGEFLFRTFPSMPASSARRTAATEYTFTSPGWRVAQTVEDIARQLHPAAFDTPSQTGQYTDPAGAR